ncbi:hypothetical protein PgNI_10667 [Pyricularia grisea]|uniref:Uncharacterized protein n=1 Tax=Pyricularia grisea TaxID=148305 RepID=A0A6P8AY17_PYRGI|nr:hypothetical protein PgNI_10667 [Pyricularia grisea]TLD07184.1 hypothetical protein PgNI_10667 [Pyricularia grisea]
MVNRDVTPRDEASALSGTAIPWQAWSLTVLQSSQVCGGVQSTYSVPGGALGVLRGKAPASNRTYSTGQIPVGLL